MSYIYDLHVHSSECSGCSSATAREMVRAYKEQGKFSGFVLTNHFRRSSEHADWEEHIQYYWKPYLEAKDEGEKLGFTVLFGLEQGYGYAQEVILYGIDIDFLRANEDIFDITPEELTKRVSDYGGFVSHAHPYRKRSYVPDVVVHMDMTVLQGIETYNAGNSELADQKAEEKCKELGLIPTAGSDRHHLKEFETNPFGGLEFDFEIKTNEELVAALKGGKGKIVHWGERVHF